jgi:hypothetical protein
MAPAAPPGRGGAKRNAWRTDVRRSQVREPARARFSRLQSEVMLFGYLF